MALMASATAVIVERLDAIFQLPPMNARRAVLSAAMADDAWVTAITGSVVGKAGG